MTFDEIQKTIEGMLAVQRNLQESQLKLVEKQSSHDENLNRIENLIAELAKIALASDKALLERIETIEERVFPEQN